MTRIHDKRYFYKYTSIETAKKILANKTLRYSSPLLFNDPFDHQIDLVVDFNGEMFIESLLKEIFEIGKNNKPVKYLDNKEWGEKLKLMISQFKHLNQDQIDLATKNLKRDLKGADRDLKSYVGAVSEAIRYDITSTRVLCVSEIKDSILMWSHYAQNHTGVVFKLLCLDEINNTLLAAKKVNYVNEPPCYASLSDFVQYVTGQTDNIVPIETLVDKIIYTKYKDWSYEKEWRAILADYDRSGAFFTDFHEETKVIDAIYLGCNISEKNMMDIVNIVGKDSNWKHVEIYKAEKAKDSFVIDFNKITL